MNETEFERYKHLDCTYQWAKSVCDPIDYISRQKVLLYSIVDFLLVPFQEEEKRRESQLILEVKKDE